MKSKQEEIDMFLRFQKRCEKGGYLEGILRGLENYVESQIRNDFAVPAMEFVNQASDTIEKALEKQKKAEARADSLQAEVQSLERHMNLKIDTIKMLETKLYESEKTAEGYRAELEKEGDRLIAERLKVSKLEAKLTKIKAANFDRIQSVLDEFRESLADLTSRFTVGAVLNSEKEE